ncbi:TPA: hypothetical protein ACG3ZP_003818 [Escherichia coli]
MTFDNTITPATADCLTGRKVPKNSYGPSTGSAMKYPAAYGGAVYLMLGFLIYA